MKDTIYLICGAIAFIFALGKLYSMVMSNIKDTKKLKEQFDKDHESKLIDQGRDEEKKKNIEKQNELINEIPDIKRDVKQLQDQYRDIDKKLDLILEKTCIGK